MKTKLQAVLMAIALSAACSFGCFGQMNVTSPSATDFVKYERIPVSYFNGLPSIDIPLYTLDYKDLHLPIHLSYYASGIKLNQYPGYVGLGWNLNAGGCITRVVNGIPDETCLKDVRDQTGYGYKGVNPGYYFCSGYLDRDDWASESRLIDYANASLRLKFKYDLQPDEFVINAYGVSGSVYFYRDKDNNLKTKVRSNNGESFRVEPPKVIENPETFKFPGGGDRPLDSYRIYELFYEFTVIKSDGTKLIFGGSDDSIEFYTEKFTEGFAVPVQVVTYLLKTWPTAWMLREVISPDGNKMHFEYQRNGSPVILSDVRTDCAVYGVNGTAALLPSQNIDRGLSFIVQHPVYPKSISTDDGLKIEFFPSKDNDLSTVGKQYEEWLQYYGFSRINDNVCYNAEGSSLRIAYAPHNYSQQLNMIKVTYNGESQHSFRFGYTENANERLKLNNVSVLGRSGITEQKYTLKYNSLKLPAYNATVTDNWGYWNNKDYRKTNIENDFFGFRSANEYYTKAEVLTEIQYPTGGCAKFDYELNDYSKIATQAPDFEILEQSGKAGGLRIKRITYSTDTASYIHSFEYKNEDGASSGILSGIPVYVAKGGNYNKCEYSSWDGLVYFRYEAVIEQKYNMCSETYINALGLTTGNYVTYSRVVEYVGDEKPLVKEYRYTNHNNWPDTADFKMFTNIDNVSLDNKFTSRELMRGLLTDEIWYSDGKKVKEIKQNYNSNPARFEDYARAVEQFSIPGVPGYLVNIPFVRYTPFKLLTFYPYLESRTETLYDPSGQTVMSSVTENFTYNGNLMPTRMTKNMSDGSIETKTITYPDDYNTDILNQMTDKGMVSSPVESLTYIDGDVAEGKLVEYELDNSIFIPRRTWTLGLTEGLDSTSFQKYTGSMYDSRYEIEAEVIDVDDSGNPILVKSADGIPVSYQWGYSSAYPVAIVSDAANTYKNNVIWEPATQVVNVWLDPEDIPQNKNYTFTSYSAGDVKMHLNGALGFDWFVYGSLDGREYGLVQRRSQLPLEAPWDKYLKAYTDDFIFTDVSKGTHTLTVNTDMRDGTGSKDKGLMTFSYPGRISHTISSGQDEFLYENFESHIGLDIYPFGYFSDKCLVGEYRIDLKGDSSRKYLLDYRVYRNGKWDYVRMSLPGRSYTINEGLNPIDDVRVWPEDACIETYSWYPFIGLRSRTDAGGVTESYIYDVCGRLQAVKNSSDDITNQYVYNYAGNSPQVYAPYYGNESMSMYFLSNRCNQSEGSFPLPVKYTVPAYKCISTVSQSDANRMAFDDLLANGQEYADENGKCESYIIVSVYNATSEAYTLEYSWGPQGDIRYLKFGIPAGERTDNTGDVTKDIVPKIIYVPRHVYRSVFLRNDKDEVIPFTAASGYTMWDFNYSAADYHDYKDTYIIQ
ncbi:MAG: hypothetical protein K2G18_03065 [Bacteroidales bacterium]|nr:hypothetical protein [Bacteroidales bacterium]